MAAGNKKATESDQETFWTKVYGVAKGAGRAYLATLPARSKSLHASFGNFQGCKDLLKTTEDQHPKCDSQVQP